ncbi:MAG: hypothetical protein JNK15_11645 [Planctomycetes bacterium]|nr:hypothetical protein [Planctomycetota bacterium]
MRRHRFPFAPCLCAALAACASSWSPTSATLAARLEETPPGTACRLWLHGDRIVAAAVPIGPGAMPAAVRTAFEAVLPGGAQTFAGREQGPRGNGFRIDKSYTDPEHLRTALVADDGSVLERAHTVPIAEVPQKVLATALRTGPAVDEAWIVSGPTTEEYWSIVLHDRTGRTFVVKVGLDGAPLGRVRRSAARVDG